MFDRVASIAPTLWTLILLKLIGRSVPPPFDFERRRRRWSSFIKNRETVYLHLCTRSVLKTNKQGEQTHNEETRDRATELLKVPCSFQDVLGSINWLWNARSIGACRRQFLTLQIYHSSSPRQFQSEMKRGKVRGEFFISRTCCTPVAMWKPCLNLFSLQCPITCV